MKFTDHAIRKILRQLPKLCDKLNISKQYRNAVFTMDENCGNDIFARVGEIGDSFASASYVIRFNPMGNMIGVWRETKETNSNNQVHTTTTRVDISLDSRKW